MEAAASDRSGIIFVIDSLAPGGAERVISDMANYWSSRGLAVTVVTLSSEADSDFYGLAAGIRRVSLSSGRSSMKWLFRIRSNINLTMQLRDVFKSAKSSVVLSFIDVANVLTILAAAGLGLRVIVSERGCPDVSSGADSKHFAYSLSVVWRQLRRLLYRRADCVTALNRNAADWIERECHVKTIVIPNSIRPLPDIDSVERNTEILGVGRLGPEKGFDLLLEAFARVSLRYPEWRLVIIGQGKEEQELRNLASNLGLDAKVQFLEPVKDIELRFARAGLVVAPSYYEAFGNVILESMAMGAAVISTECSGPLSMIEDGVNGRIVPVGDVTALSNAMSELLSSPALRSRIGREARKVRTTFEQEAVMSLWEACLFPGLDAVGIEEPRKGPARSS